MTKLFTDEELENAKSRDKLPLRCIHCGKTFYVQKNYIMRLIANRTSHAKYDFCSSICESLHNGYLLTVDCKNCGKSFSKKKKDVKRVVNNFCCRSCNAKYNNSHKKTGTNVSKLEKWIASKLIELYPNLDFHFNRVDTIKAELDIYIPSLKLAFELNGIFHYEPIFGEDSLKRIQNREKIKFQLCFEKGIELCIIDISKQKYFKESTSFIYLEIVTNIINQKMEPATDSTPYNPDYKSGT